MGRRYYCDYCDRSFVDEIQARKKHLQSASHVRNYKLHYIKYRDLKTLIKEEAKKEECYKFTKSGQCAFGDGCYRSHFTRQQLNLFRNQFEEEKRLKAMYHIAELKTVDSWLQKRKTGILTFEDSSENQMTGRSVTPYFAYPSVPPSLRGIDTLKPTDLNVTEWG